MPEPRQRHVAWKSPADEPGQLGRDVLDGFVGEMGVDFKPSRNFRRFRQCVDGKPSNLDLRLDARVAAFFESSRERVGRAYGRQVAHECLPHGAGENVLGQAFERIVHRLEAQGGSGGQVAAAQRDARLLAEREQAEPRHAGRMDPVCRLTVGIEPYGHVVAFVVEGWIMFQLPASLAARHLFGQRTEIPRHIFRLGRRGCRGRSRNAGGGERLIEIARFAEDASRGIVLDAEAHTQVRGDALGVPGIGRDANAPLPLHGMPDRIIQRFFARLEMEHETGHRVGKGRKHATLGGRQDRQHPEQFFRQGTRHQPVRAPKAERGGIGLADGTGDAVGRFVVGRVTVGEGHAGIADANCFGEVARGGRSLRPPVGFLETELRRQVGMQPLAQRGYGGYLGWNDLVEVREEPVFVEQLRLARLFGQPAKRIQERIVFAHGRRRMRNVAIDQSPPNEDFACLGQVEAAVVAAAGGNDHETVERNLFCGADKSGDGIPFGRMAMVAAKRTGGGFDPARVDHGGIAREKTGCIH